MALNESTRPKFCSACGGNLQLRQIDGRERPICPKCARVHYGQLIVGAGCLIEDGNRLLLIRRVKEPFQGSWCLPAGHVDDDEHPALAAQRETLEETGLQVGVGELVGAYFSDDHPKGCGVFLVYRGTILGGNLRETAEGLTPTFFAHGALPAQLAGGGHRGAIEAWHKRVSQPTTQPLNLQSQLSTVWTARYQQDQVLWRIFAAFWPTNAILLAALFRSSGQTLPPKIGVTTALCGLFVALLWFLVQRRALGHVKRLESIAAEIEKILLPGPLSAYALSPGSAPAGGARIGSIKARVLMPLCTAIVFIAWLSDLIYFVRHL